MPIDIQYNGTQDRWSELPITGKQSVWFRGQQDIRNDSEAGLLLATGLFTRVSDGAVPGAGISADADNALTLGSDDLPYLDGDSVGGSGARVVQEASVFQAELRTSTAPLTPDGANISVTFSRLFALATLQASGLYADTAHQTPAFAWVPGVARLMFAGGTGGTGLIFSAGNENRDLTLAAWTKTNMTAAKNVTGIDGASNSASSLTATANLGTALFPATAAALSRIFQAHVSRRAGYGRVWMTGDGGTSWTDITARIGPTFARVHIPVSGANPSFGFMLENSGDAINVDSVAAFNGTYPVPTAFLSRADIQGQTLTYTGARKTTANPAFSIEFNWYFDDTPVGSVALNNGGGNPQLIVLQSATNPPPSVQLITSSGALYAGIPSLYIGTKKVSERQVHKYRVVCVGQTLFSYMDGEPVGIYDATTPPAGLTLDNFKDLTVSPAAGNYISDLNVSDFTGRVIVALGDSISVIESYRQAWIKAMPEGAIFCQRGVSGNTVAQVRDRIAADLALSLPAGNACYVLLWCGTNSLANNVAPATALAELQTAITNILAINANTKIIVPTTLTYRTGGLTGIDAATFTANATTYNAGLSALTGVYKVVEVNDATSTAADFFLADGIHPKGQNFASLVRRIAPWVA
jgi:hypothetical protein